MERPEIHHYVTGIDNVHQYLAGMMKWANEANKYMTNLEQEKYGSDYKRGYDKGLTDGANFMIDTH